MEFNEMLHKVAAALELSPALILQPSRKRKQVEARFILYLLLDDQHEHVSDIARRFNQDRSTVIYGLEKARAALKYDRYFKAKYGKCLRALQQVKATAAEVFPTIKEPHPLDKKSWLELHQAGELETLLKERPDLFREKFKEHFGKEPGLKYLNYLK